jgi:solute:Na+ symporter, SSS family
VSHVNVITFTIVVVLFLVVTGVGFAAVRWRRTEDMLHLNEWGLGGRGFGTFISWFMLGGDVYTAYTYIAVPAVIFASGSIGFFAVSYTIMVYPIILIFLPRLWSVSRVHNYITPADFIRGRYGSRGLSLAAAFTGILSLMPYIALQLVGIEAVLTVMGVGTSSNSTFVKDLPLFIAFLVLAIFTFVSGLRAPAAISFIKDTLVYVMVIVAVFYIPTRLGGWGHIFGTAQTHFTAINPVTKKPNGTFIPTSKATGSTQLDFATLALGSAVALFLYPHTITGSLASKRRYVVKRNTALLPIYSILLGLIALLGYMAITDKTTVANVKKAGDNAQLAVPYLFQHMFSSWFAGVAFAAIIIGALVPAAIMAIAAANLFTRNIFTEYFKPDASPRLQTRVAQWASLVVKLGALYFAVELPHTFAINLQLLGGVWILQLAPMLIGGLFTRWFDRYALLLGWLAGMLFGTIAAYKSASPTVSHWASSADIELGHTVYIGLSAVIINLIIAVILTVIFRAAKVPQGADETLPHQYTADPADLPAPTPAGIGLDAAGAAGNLA